MLLVKFIIVAGQIEDDLIVLHWTVGFLRGIKSYFEYFANKSKSFWKNRIFYVDKKYNILWIIKIDILRVILEEWNDENLKKNSEGLCDRRIKKRRDNLLLILVFRLVSRIKV